MSKYENKFAKLQKKAAEFNFRNQLKVVKKKEFTLEEEDKENEVFIWKKRMIFLYKMFVRLTKHWDHLISEKAWLGFGWKRGKI